MTTIEWTRNDDGTPGKTWNPLRGCSRVSPGCDACYAMRTAHRFSGVFADKDGSRLRDGPYEGLTTLRQGKVDWSGKVRFVPEKLDEPLRWRKPQRVFVNSMSDLFHESVANEVIAAVFGVMAATPQHEYIVLTKRARRMRQWFEWVAAQAIDEGAAIGGIIGHWHGPVDSCFGFAEKHLPTYTLGDGRAVTEQRWPLPNLILCVSAENQSTANERVPHLLATPAAVRGVSCEPLLGPIDLHKYVGHFCACGILGDACDEWKGGNRCPVAAPRLDLVIVGSESGHGARHMRIEWAESLRDQCRAAGVAFFTKQIASASDKKGGRPELWPPGEWPREWPEVRR